MTEVEEGACDGPVPGYSAHRPGPTRGQDCHLCHQVFQQGKHISKRTVLPILHGEYMEPSPAAS